MTKPVRGDSRRELRLVPVSEVVSKATVLRRIELDILRRLDGRLSGDHLSHAAGPGSERAGARRYEPGDDARQIDWNLTARAAETHVRTTEADRELETWVVADRSPSLDFGTAQHEKRDVVLAVTAAFGILTIRAGNRFGVLTCGGERLVRVPQTVGRTGLLAALSVLHDSPRAAAGPDGSTDLAAALTQLSRTQQRRGQVVVVSDFLDSSDWHRPLRALALRHQVIAVQVTDPRELTLPDVGMLAMVDPESGHELTVQTSSASLRERFAAVAADRQREIRGRLLASGAETLALSTDRDWVLDTLAFAARRRRDRRMSPLSAAQTARTSGAS
jgi:uncharacterized protein (DUF58 family)